MLIFSCGEAGWSYCLKYRDLNSSTLLENLGGNTLPVVEGGSNREDGGRPEGVVSTTMAADALRHFGKLSPC